MKTLGILGTGHLGQQIAHFAITDGHYTKVVFFDDFTNENQIKGYDVVGKSATIQQKHSEGRFDELILGIGYKHLSKKKEIFDKLYQKIPFGTIVHSSCTVDSTAVVEKGSVIYPNCCLDARAVIKGNTIVNISSVISHDSIIGRHCYLSPSVAIAGFASIADTCFIGINATIIDSIKIASGIHVGAAAVVIDNLNKEGLYVGNPARFIR